MNDSRPIILDRIESGLDVDALRRALHVAAGSEDEARLLGLIDQAHVVARPKAVFRVGYVRARADRRVTIDDVVLESHLLRTNLEAVERVFPFVATCGTEVDEWSAGHDPGDMLAGWWLDSIRQQLLRSALQAVREEVQRRYVTGKLAIMNPGSLPDWPMPQQRPLFELLGDYPGRIGVRLTESFLMIPMKSVSGLAFPTATEWENCRLCPREDCPGRRAPYDSALHAEHFGQ